MSYGINHQVGVKASPKEIYKYLTETAKLAQWWTTDTRGSGAKVGHTLELWFYGFCQNFSVKELTPGKRVAWKSPKGQGSDERDSSSTSCAILIAWPATAERSLSSFCQDLAMRIA
jgi:hypothetical protein